MAFIRSAIIAVLISMVAWPDVILGGDVKKYVKIDAAFGYKRDGVFEMLYLFSGPEVQILQDGGARKVVTKEEVGVPSDMNVKAAYRVDENTIIYYGQGDYGVVYSKNAKIKHRRFKYAKGSAGGPDAAGRKGGGSVYLFFGCEMVEKLGPKKWGPRIKLADMGLPCDVDAAYSQDNYLIILKGDQFYAWMANGSVIGPYKYNDSLMNGWVLQPSQSAP